MTHTLKQKIALAVALAVAVALVFVSVVAGVGIYAMSSGKSNYGENEYPRSAQSYGIGTRVIPEQLDQWEAYFGQGTAEIRADAVDAGVDTLSVALKRVPKDADSDEPPTGAEKLNFTPECRVRINWRWGRRFWATDSMRDISTRLVRRSGASATVAQRPRVSRRSKIPTTRRRTRKNCNTQERDPEKTPRWGRSNGRRSAKHRGPQGDELKRRAEGPSA